MFFANLDTIATGTAVKELERFGFDVFGSENFKGKHILNIDETKAHNTLPLDVYDTKINK